MRLFQISALIIGVQATLAASLSGSEQQVAATKGGKAM
jgi:hypothetical protein